MRGSDTEGRAPIAAELVRDFEVLLDERLTQERRRRRSSERLTRIALGVAVTSLLLLAIVAYTLYDRRGPGISAGVVRAGELRLVDGEGRVRGRWSVLADGSARISLLDEQGTERLRLTVLDNGSQGISLSDSRGEGRVVLSLEEGEGSRLTFADAAGRTRTVLGLSSQFAGTLLFADADGAPRAAFGLEPDGRAMFMLPEGRSRDTTPDDTTSAATTGRNGGSR